MFTAIKTFSQVCTHMSIAFGLAYLLTGSLALGGLAAIIEPIINVALLPWHEKAWHAIRRRYAASRLGFAALAGEKLSQTTLHMGVAFGVMLAAIIAPFRLDSSVALALATGAVFGLLLYVLNFYGMAGVYTWFVALRGWPTAIAHVIFGMTAAFIYLKLERPSRPR